MNFVDFGLIIIITISALVGYKSGVIKTFARMASLVIAAIIAYSFKDMLANFLIDFMPFFNFEGMFKGITGINILFYHGASFIVLFIIIYSLLSIVIMLAGFIDRLLKMTIILYLPDKILGGLLGAVYGVIISFILIFSMSMLPNTQKYVIDSSYGYIILNRTPIIRTVLAKTTVVTSEIKDIMNDKEGNSEEEIKSVQLSVLDTFIKYGYITKEAAAKLIEENKIDLPGVKFN